MIYTVTFNPAIDYVVQLDSPLEIGGVNRASAEHCVLGGKGINVSGVLTELGCGNVALGFVAGETGAWLERGLAARGQRTDFIRLDSGMTRINVKIKGAEETELNGAARRSPPRRWNSCTGSWMPFCRGMSLYWRAVFLPVCPRTPINRS